MLTPSRITAPCFLAKYRVECNIPWSFTATADSVVLARVVHWAWHTVPGRSIQRRCHLDDNRRDATGE